MTATVSKEIRTEINEEGKLYLSISTSDVPVPGDDEVLIKVEASPINPSDLGLLISFAADLNFSLLNNFLLPVGKKTKKPHI